MSASNGGALLLNANYKWTGTHDFSAGAMVLPTGGVSSGALATSLLQTVSGVLTSAQVTTLHSVPVTLVPAPASTQVVIFLSAFFSFPYNSVQYTGGGAVSLVQHGLSVNQMAGTIAAASILAAANFSAFFIPVQTAGGTLTTGAGGLGLDLSAASADFAAGNSTLKYQISYYLGTL